MRYPNKKIDSTPATMIMASPRHKAAQALDHPHARAEEQQRKDEKLYVCHERSPSPSGINDWRSKLEVSADPPRKSAASAAGTAEPVRARPRNQTNMSPQ
jgi:hypothetical protein